MLSSLFTSRSLYITHTSCYYCLGLTLCYMQQIVTQIYLLCHFIWLILFSSTFAILHFLGADTVTEIIYVDSNSHNLWATLKWSFTSLFDCRPPIRPTIKNLSWHCDIRRPTWVQYSGVNPIRYLNFRAKHFKAKRFRIKHFWANLVNII